MKTNTNLCFYSEKYLLVLKGLSAYGENQHMIMMINQDIYTDSSRVKVYFYVLQ